MTLNTTLAMSFSRSDLTILLIWLIVAAFMIVVTEIGILLILKDLDPPSPFLPEQHQRV